MSKRVPVYLSEEEIAEILRWARITAYKDDIDYRLEEHLEAELATFEE